MTMQSTDTVLMISPLHFGFNHETESSNAFQSSSEILDVSTKSVQEFQEVVRRLRDEGVNVLVFDDRESVVCPDAVFPNNWLGVHPGNLIVTYPMMAPSRRLEKREDILNQLLTQSSRRRFQDFSMFEEKQQYLEGTGSIVFDHLNKIAYAALSPRTHEAPARKLADTLGYELMSFNTLDETGKPVYHTNVILSIGTNFIILSTEYISDSDKERLKGSLKKGGRMILEIDMKQTKAFAGNILELRNHLDEKIILLSETALNALNDFQISALQKAGLLLPVSIPTIEQLGGGGVRCMVAEIF
jgi:hypothetical protein